MLSCDYGIRQRGGVGAKHECKVCLVHQVGGYPRFLKPAKADVFPAVSAETSISRKYVCVRSLQFLQREAVRGISTPGQMLVDHRVTPSIKFSGGHLYTWAERVERRTVRVKGYAQEHNTVPPARVQTQTTPSRDKCIDHDATAPPIRGVQVGPIAFEDTCRRFN